MDDSELESFRQRWREEVSARAKGNTRSKETSFIQSASRPAKQTQKSPPAPTTLPPVGVVEDDEIIGRTFHDLENKEDNLKLGDEHSNPRPDALAEPRSALEHYEKAVERETQGNLGDSVNHYRRAFKLDAGVQEDYKRKHFPQPLQPSKPTNTNPSNAPVTVPNTAHHSLYGPSSTLNELLDEFSKLSIPQAEPETSISPPSPCPIALIPEEVIAEILLNVAVSDVADLARLAQVCKRFAYLIMSEERIWKRLALGSEYGFAAMHYRYMCDLQGQPLHDAMLLNVWPTPTAPLHLDLTPALYPTYRSQFRNRPRIRFNGCYISTVNYSRAGGASQSQYTWTSPIHIVTYYRYLRFFRDGRAISLLTTAEPADVVHHLLFENVHRDHSGGLPSAVMKDALRGRWRLSGSADIVPSEDDNFGGSEEEFKGPGKYLKEPAHTVGDGQEGGVEAEGDLHIETEGVVPKYMWKMQLSLGSSGRKDGTRNNKLSWKGFWSYNKLTDDWGDFRLNHDRAFYWSRVKSYRDD